MTKNQKRKPKAAGKHRIIWTDKGLYCHDCKSYVDPEKGSRKIV